MTESPSDVGRARGARWVSALLSPIADVRRDEVASVLLMTLADVPDPGGVLHAEDRPRGLHPQRRRRRGEELLVGRPGGAAAVPRAGLRRVCVAGQPRAARPVGDAVLRVATWCCSCSRCGAGLHIGIVYFLWVGIFNVMVIAQFWAFAADLYTPEQGKRLFPLIGVGSSLGAWVGSVRAGQLMEAFGPAAPDRRRGGRAGRVRRAGSPGQSRHRASRSRPAAAARRTSRWATRTGSR